MNLLAIEVDLESFFDINLIVFTTISFAFSVVVIAFIVFALRPLSRRASIARGRTPERLGVMYIRLLMYGFAQFMAFITDIFLVVFGHNYKLPWFTTTIFLTLIFYKLVFVLFKNFRDLGYNAEGITKTLKTASEVATKKNLEPLNESIKNVEMKNKTPKKKKSKITYKNRRPKSKTPFIMLLVFLSILCGVRKYDTNIRQEIVIANILTRDSYYEQGCFNDDLIIKIKDRRVLIKDVDFKSSVKKERWETVDQTTYIDN